MNSRGRGGAAALAAMAVTVAVAATASAQILSATDKVTARQALEAGKSKNVIRERLPILGSFRSASAIRDDTLKPGQVRDYTASFTRGDVVNIEFRTSNPGVRFAILAPSADFPLFAGDVAGGSRAYRGIANRTSEYTIRVFLNPAAPKKAGEKNEGKDTKDAVKEARYLLTVSRQ